MRINTNNTGLSYGLSKVWTDSSTDGPRKAADVLREMGYDVDKMPIKLDISEEGLSAYKHMAQNSDSDMKIYKICVPCEQPPEFGGEGWPEKEDFLGQGFACRMIRGKYPPSYHFDAYVPIQDKASALLNSYKKCYDEIVKGYEKGTREKYVLDNNTEKGYRKATMEEDLDDLRKEFEGLSEMLERYVLERDCKTRRMEASYAEKELANGVTTLGNAVKSKMLYERMKGDEKVENIKQKLAEAGSLFVSQYKELGLNRLPNASEYFDKVTVSLS